MKCFLDRYIGRFCIAILLLVGLAVRAESATVSVTWVNPTTNTDESAIPSSGDGSIASARVEYGTCTSTGTFGTKVGEVIRARGTNLPATSATLNLPVGVSCVQVKVSNTYGKESDASNVISRTVDAPTPKPPVLATVAPQAYSVVPDYKRFAFTQGKQIGTVRIGAACDRDRAAGADLYAVVQYNKAVKLWAGVPQQQAVLARCG